MWDTYRGKEFARNVFVVAAFTIFDFLKNANPARIEYRTVPISSPVCKFSFNFRVGPSLVMVGRC
jgi:hypothetical protein